jgi:hypothetical protein
MVGIAFLTYTLFIGLRHRRDTYLSYSVLV